MSLDIEAKLAELLGPVLAPLATEERPAIIALAERIAAGRYRAWSEQVTEDETRTRLLACAAREEEIATRVEALNPSASDLQARAIEEHGDLPDRYAALFTDLPLAEQFGLQARAERVGAATWRALAGGSEGAAVETFLTCAQLEEVSAETLEALIAEGALPRAPVEA